MNTGPLITLVLAALLLVIAALRALLGYRAVHADARAEWPDFQKNRPDLAKGLDEPRFHHAFVRAHGPRGALYGAITLTAAAVLTPLIMVVLTWLYAGLIASPENASAIAPDFAVEVRRQFHLDGPLVYSFFIFFGLIASWGLTAFFVSRHYHRHRPGTLEDEIRKIRGDAALPKASPARPRPRWSPLVQTKDGLRLPGAGPADNKEQG